MASRPARRIVRSALLFTGVGALSAASLVFAAVVANAKPGSPDRPSAAPFEESTQVVSIEVPVNVVNRDGQPVRGLQASDFEVFDESTQQKISSFQVVDLDVNVPQGAEAVADEYLRGTTRRRFLLLFDLTFSNPTAILKARTAARDFILHSLHPGDLAGVGTVSLEQGFRSVVTFTPDRAQVARGIDTLGYHQGENYARLDPLRFMISPNAVETLENATSPDQAIKLGGAGEKSGELRDYLAALSVMAERDQRTYDRSRIVNMLHILGGLAHSLNAVHGRKNVVLFSEGFESRLLLGRDPSQTDEQSDEAQHVEAGDIWRVDSDQRYGNTELQASAGRVLEEFRRADAVIQAVDIGGLRADTDPDKRSQSGGQDALFFMANETGGELFKNANNLRPELDRVLQRSSVTYLLTFERADLKTDGAYRHLRVKVKSPGARVSSRAGYYAPRPFRELSPLERNLLASDSIASAVPRSDIDLRALIAPFRAGPGQAYVPVIVEIGGMSMLSGQRGERLNLEIYTYVSDGQGEMRDFFTQIVGIDLGKARAVIEHSGVKYYGHLALGAGDYLVRVLVRNAETGRSGVQTVRLKVPDYKAPVLLPPFFFESPGRWVMVRESSGQPAQKTVVYPFTVNGEPYIPAARPEIAAGTPARLCLVAYSLGAAKPSIETQVVDGNGNPVASGQVAILERTVTGIVGFDQLLASFDATGLAPGEYTLHIGLTDGTSGNKQTNSIPFAVRN
ncbi:MAG: VWA domain-containing protein [Acidobacteriota bacterium]